MVFHILTFGIPLAIYHIISCFYSKRDIPSENGKFVDQAIQTVQQNQEIKPYSLRGKEALEFTRKKLTEKSEVSPSNPASNTLPFYKEIGELRALYWNVALKEFRELMQQNQKNPWSNPAVINAADALMKIGFAISNLTLDTLEPYTKYRSSHGEKVTYATALTRQDSYQYRTFYYCTNVYHWLRGAIEWRTHDILGETGLFYSKSDIPKSHASLFYTKGTIQNSWNQLYNEYCDRIRLYVKEKDLFDHDNRHVRWTRKDTGISKFCQVPDTQPT